MTICGISVDAIEGAEVARGRDLHRPAGELAGGGNIASTQH